MATVSHVTGSELATSNNVTTYLSNSVTPAGNALLIVPAMITASSEASPTCTASANSMTFTFVVTASKAAGDRAYFFISDQLTPASPVAMTVTVGVPSDAGTGGIVAIEQVTGMTLTGTAAIKQFKAANGGAGTTPAVTFDAAVDTNNPTLVIHMDTSATGTTPPASWTEAFDTSFGTPTAGGSVVYRDSGFSGTTITWGSTSTLHSEIGIELDASAPAKGPVYRRDPHRGLVMR